jgi:hypothetical protein
MTDNVIVFPKSKKDTPPLTMQEIVEKQEEVRKGHIEFVLDEVLANCFGFCYNEGFDLGRDDCVKTTGLVIEALRAALFKSVGLNHQLHELADSLYIQSSVEDNVE